MSLTPASQCGRIVRRHVYTPSDSVWISDGALSSVFERYCAISKTSVRYGSSLPGPMENRRRLGKRHMGELSFGQSHTGAPLWEIANTVDLTQWKWQPPTLYGSRRRDRQARRAKPLTFGGMISNWLSSPDPGLAEYSQNINDLPSEVPEQPAAEMSAPQDVPTMIWDTHADPQELVDQGLNLLLIDMSLDSTLSTTPNFSHFCNAFNWNLSNGRLSDESICLISRKIRGSLVRTFGPLDEDWKQRRVDDLKLQLLRALLAGLSTRLSNGSHPFESSSWNDLLLGISKLRRNGLRIFSRAMVHIPKSNLSNVSAGILANLDAYFVAMGRGKDVRNSTLVRQANILSNALWRLDADADANILTAATLKVSRYVGTEQLNYEQIRSSWLHVLARMPGICQKYLARTCATLEAAKDTRPLTRTEIGRLFIAQCHKRKNSNLDDVYFLYQALNDKAGPSHSNRYAILCSRFWTTGQFPHIRGLCRFLRDLGRTQDLFQLVRGFNDLVQNHATPLVTLAIGIGDPQLAIRISTLYADSVEKDRDREFWGSEFGAQAVKELLTTRSMRTSKLFGALGMVRKRRDRVLRSRRRGRSAIPLSQIEKVARLTELLAAAPYLSNRTSFSLVSLCIHYLRYHNAGLPPEVIRALIHNVTRDLAEGKVGKTARIIWVLRQASQHTSPLVAWRLKLAIERWRRQNLGLPPQDPLVHRGRAPCLLSTQYSWV